MHFLFDSQGVKHLNCAMLMFTGIARNPGDQRKLSSPTVKVQGKHFFFGDVIDYAHYRPQEA